MPVADDQVARVVAVLGPTAPLPTDGGEPRFAEPWEGRAFAMALDVVDRDGRSWEDFRARLVAAIAEDPQRPYYASWVVALERLVVATTPVTAADLDRARNGASAYRYDEPGLGAIEVFPIHGDAPVVHELLRETFGGPWAPQLRLLPTAIGAAHAPPIGPDAEVPAVAEVLDVVGGRCRHAELYRRWSDGSPRSWGLRLFDDADQRLLDVALPNPRFDGADRRTPPDWSRLSCWDHLRRRFLDLAPDPADRRTT